MNSLKDKYISTETVIINMTGYRFEITGDHIIRYGLKTSETSKGHLVKRHFDNVFGVLYLSHLLKDCGVKESISSYWMGEEEKKRYEEAPTLEKCVDMLCRQLSLLTDGVYDEYYENCRKRHGGVTPDGKRSYGLDADGNFYDTEKRDDESGDGWRDFNLPFEMQMQDIFWDILDLREGKYHRSGNFRYDDRRGIPKIETVGERMYSRLLDMIWKMDNE